MLITAFIHSLEVCLLSLSSLLVFRVTKLASAEKSAQGISNNELHIDSTIDEPIEVDVSDYDLKMDSLKSAQMFVGSQLVAVKRDFDNLQNEQLSWLREAISLYLIGAVDFIGKQSNCGLKGRKELIRLVLKSNLHLSQDSASKYFNDALHRTPSSDSDHMVRAGAKAAKMWLKQKAVPSDFSLRAQLDDWGVFA